MHLYIFFFLEQVIFAFAQLLKSFTDSPYSKYFFVSGGVSGSFLPARQALGHMHQHQGRQQQLGLSEDES
jgi:hypothetical protein